MTDRTIKQLGLIAGAACLLAACATKHPVAQADWDLGARQGKITRVYSLTALPGNDPLPVCLAQLSPADGAAHHYVQVRYSQARHAHFVVAVLPDTLVAGIGASVEVWPADCSAGQVGRISQVFTPAPL